MPMSSSQNEAIAAAPATSQPKAPKSDRRRHTAPQSARGRRAPHCARRGTRRGLARRRRSRNRCGFARATGLTAIAAAVDEQQNRRARAPRRAESAARRGRTPRQTREPSADTGDGAAMSPGRMRYSARMWTNQVKSKSLCARAPQENADQRACRDDDEDRMRPASLRIPSAHLYLVGQIAAGGGRGGGEREGWPAAGRS